MTTCSLVQVLGSAPTTHLHLNVPTLGYNLTSANAQVTAEGKLMQWRSLLELSAHSSRTVLPLTAVARKLDGMAGTGRLTVQAHGVHAELPDGFADWIWKQYSTPTSVVRAMVIG